MAFMYHIAAVAARAAVEASGELQKRKPNPIGPYMPSPDGKQFNVVASLGAENIGIWISQTIYGFNILQGIRYWSNFQNDHWLMKSTVAFLMVLDFAGVVAYLRLMWFWDVLSWGNLYNLTVLDWSFFMDVLMTGLVPTIVQFYFCWRVYAISGRTARIMPAIIVLLSLVQLGFCTATVPVVWYLGIPDKIGDWLWGVYCWFIPGCLADALITINMLYYIRQAKKTSDFARTRGIMNKFIVLVFETNAITFLGALSILVVFAASNHLSLAYNALTYVVTKVYVLSLLLATNIRIDLRDHSNNATGMELSGSRGEEYRHAVSRSRGGAPTQLSHAQSWNGTRSYNETRSYGDNRGPMPYAQGVQVTNVTMVTHEEAQNEKAEMDIRYHHKGGHGVDELHYAA